MNYNDFLYTERIAQRAVNAAKTFADKADAKALDQITFLMAELRHAASTLCADWDKSATQEEITFGRQKALERLEEIFTVRGGF